MTAPAAERIDPEVLRDQMLDAFEESRRPLEDNTAYYESERRPSAIGVATPPQMRNLLANVGYPRLYVNAVAERLELEGFRMAGADSADETLWDWWQANDLDTSATLGFVEAMVHGRAYITISAPDPEDKTLDPNIPIIRVESPNTMHATIDPRTNQVTAAIRAVYGADGSQVEAATLYTPEQTISWVRVEGQWTPLQSVNHGIEMVPVVPLANRTRLSDTLGTSEITPELRSVTDAAARIMMNMQATAELMAVPQRLLFGVKPEDIGVDPETGQSLFDAYLARILAFEDADSKAQQFAAAELRNFTGALEELAKQAAAYTGLPPQYLASSSDNPASAEAIKASEARLVKNAERKAKIFGGAWEQAMRVAHKVMNPGGELPSEMYRMETIWRDPSTPTYAAKADAASKLYANGTGVIPKERARIDMGYTVTERLEMKKWDEEEQALDPLNSLYGDPRRPGSEPAVTDSEPAVTKGAKAPAE